MSSEESKPISSNTDQNSEPVIPSSKKGLLKSEDWWAVWLGGFLLVVGLAATFFTRPSDAQTIVSEIKNRTEKVDQFHQQLKNTSDAGQEEELQNKIAHEKSEIKDLRSELASNPLKSLVGKPGKWSNNPLAAFTPKSLPGILGIFAISLLLFGFGALVMEVPFTTFAPGFCFVFGLGLIAYLLAGQQVVSYYHLGYALWALVIGLLISNTIGTPQFVRPAVRTEFYIKTGLVLLGAEILFSRLIALGIPGIFVAWVVTPIVLVSTYLFGQYILRISSKSLNIVISADMSVCGVSAAIATAAACRAKKEELSLAIGMSMAFTVVMMIAMPAFIRAVGMGELLGGAWMGGTIDATGAVAAAGEFLSEGKNSIAVQVAATVKMIQNILIGLIAFGVAIFWVLVVERSNNASRPDIRELWYRFPKFVLGFIAASLVFSLLYSSGIPGKETANSVIQGTAKPLRGWFFCLAFVSIGLESNFRELWGNLKGGKPLILYACGQTLNLILTLFMAWLMFTQVFPNAAETLSK